MKNEFTQHQLMQLFLAVYTAQHEHDKTATIKYTETFSNIMDTYSDVYEVTPHGLESEKLHTQELMDKILTMIEGV